MRASYRPNRNTLGNVEIFSREVDGRITDYKLATRAWYNGENWELTGVKRLQILAADGRDLDAEVIPEKVIWESAQTPSSIARLAAEPRDLSLKDMKSFSERGNSGAKPRFAYGFWHAHRLTRPIAAFVLLLCAIPIMQNVGRQDTGDRALVMGILMGFIYLIIDGALATFATTGGMSIAAAIISPFILFGLLGSYLCLRSETL